MKRSRIFIMGVLALLIFAACGGNDSWNESVAEPAPMAADGSFRATSVDAPVGAAPGYAWYGAFDGDFEPVEQVEWEEIAERPERHIIQTATVEATTEDFDDAVAAFRRLAPDAGGYVQYEELTNHGRRVFTIVMRIPAGEFAAVLARAEAIATVRHTNQRAEDVTDRFHDMAGSLETRRIEEERILALIGEAENVADILALEMRLSNTRQSIESYLAQLNAMAGQIAFSTITVTLFDVYAQEIVVAAPTFGERIGGAFGDSVDTTANAAQNFIVFLAGAVIPLGIFAIIAFAVYLLVKLLIKKVNPAPQDL